MHCVHYVLLTLWILHSVFSVLSLPEALPSGHFIDSLLLKKGTHSIVHPRIYRLGDSVLLFVKFRNDTFYVHLQPPTNTVLPKFTAFGRQVTNEIGQDGPCQHYNGYIISHPYGEAAITICNRKKQTVSGIIVLNEEVYLIRPVEHILHKRAVNISSFENNEVMSNVIFNPDEQYQSFCGVDLANVNEDYRRSLFSRLRVKRTDSSGRKVIETAVFVDYPLYKKLSRSSTEDDEDSIAKVYNAVLAIVNEVQLIYNYKSLKTKFKIVVVKMEILSENKEAPDSANGDIDQYLDNFCTWQSLKNPPASSDEHWDHALMLTGLDLHKVTNGDLKNEKVLGLAWVNGMCRPRHSCTLNEGSSFEAAFVIAHEMGHSLGMLHDGRGNDCDPSTFLMSEKTGPGKITWSTCSNDYLDRFFQKGFGSCLEDDNSPPAPDMNHEGDNRLPGERFPLDEQCKLSLGDNFRPHVVPKEPFNDVCRELWCVSGLWASVAHPALEGSSCGNGKQCIQGACTEVASFSSSSRSSSSAAREILEDMKDAVSEFLDRLKSAFKMLTT